jgi:glycosyltransferase involved in cell wall biosynthesis
MMPPEPVRIHIVEPTLESEAGHCHSFVQSICKARREGDGEITVYAGSRARLPGLESPGVRVVPFFHRRFRRPEAFFLYRRLLREPGRILVSTAGRADMLSLSLAAGGTVPPGKVFLYLHWVTPTPSKKEFFRRMSARQPNLVLMGPTGTVAGVFRSCGFRDVRTVPYPITPADPDPSAAGGRFRHVLYAGAARRDKGFPRVVDLVRRLAEAGAEVPMAVQASASHYGKYDEGVLAELARLREAAYPSLRMIPDTLGAREYRAMFEGAIVLQPYSRDDFTDRISGVTLDAFSAGAPIVATSGTWMARSAERFGAGVGLDDLTPEALLRAVETIRADYPRFRRNAIEAGRALQAEHGARQLLDAVMFSPGEGR